MISFYSPNVPDPWTNDDLFKYDQSGSQRDEIIFNSFHNAKLRLLEKNLFICSFKMKEGGYKNIYVMPVTASKFIFFAYIPQLEYVTQMRSYEGANQLINKLPLLGSISQKILGGGEYRVNNNLSFFTEGVLSLVVNAPIGQFLFPKHKKIENPEILTKYGIISGLYAQIAKEYEALGKTIKKINDDKEEREVKLKFLMAKQVIKTGIKIGLYASGVGAGVAALMDIDDIWSSGNAITDISTISDVSDLTDMVDAATIVDVTDLADGLIDVSSLTDYSDLSDLAGVDSFDIPNEYESSCSDLSSDGYNVSFGAQKERLTSQGGGLHIDATIEKEPGSSSKFCIKTNKGIVHNVSNGDLWVEINGINYKLPRLKG